MAPEPLEMAISVLQKVQTAQTKEWCSEALFWLVENLFSALFEPSAESFNSYSCLNISRESTTQRKVECWCVFSFTIPGDNFFGEMIKSSHHQDSSSRRQTSSLESFSRQTIQPFVSSSLSLSLWGWGWRQYEYFLVVIYTWMEVCIRSNSFASQTVSPSVHATNYKWHHVSVLISSVISQSLSLRRAGGSQNLGDIHLRDI